MKNFFKTLALFIPISIFIYLAGIIICEKYMPYTLKKNVVFPFQGYGFMFTRLQEAKAIKNLNYLFLGSSHAYRGIDTRNFIHNGQNAFNLGSSSQTPIQSKWLLEQYLDKLQPDTIILEVYPATFELDGTESTLDILANERFSLKSFELLYKTFNIKVLNAMILSAFQTYIQPERFSKKETWDRTDGKYINGGYVETDSCNSGRLQFGKRSKWKLEEKQMKAFEEMIILIKQKQIPFILLQAPVTKALYDSYAGNEEFDEKMKSFGRYINFNELPLNDTLHFYDSNHLNISGVNIFNKALIKALQSPY